MSDQTLVAAAVVTEDAASLGCKQGTSASRGLLVKDGTIIVGCEDSCLDPSTSSLAAEAGLMGGGRTGRGADGNPAPKSRHCNVLDRAQYGVVKKEMKERKKVDSLNKVVDELVAGVGELTGRPSSPLAFNGSKSELLRCVVDDVRRLVDDYRRRKDLLDKQICQLKTQVEQNEENVELKKRQDSDLSKLNIQVQETKNEMTNIFRSINQSLSLINSRLNTDYRVDENEESTAPLRNILDKLLNDVASTVTQHKKSAETLNDLKRKLDENSRNIEQSKQMHDFMVQESKKLLTIGSDRRAEAEKIDPSNFDAVRKFVEETFRLLLETLKKRSQELTDITEARKQAEHEDQVRKVDIEREIAVKQAKIESTRDALNKLHVQNEFLRQQLIKEQNPVADEEEAEMIKSIKDHKKRTPRLIVHRFLPLNCSLHGNIIKALQEEIDKNQNAALQAQLEKSRAQNEETKRHLAELTNEINESEEKLARKRQELKEINEKAEKDREANKQSITEMEKKILEADQEIGVLERQLSEMDSKSDEIKTLKQEVEKLCKTEKDLTSKLQKVDSQLKAVENERHQLTEDLNKEIEECNNLRIQLRNEDVRRETLEEKLQDIKEKIADTDRRVLSLFLLQQ
uniref:Uncharacterized protein n=1 Tax=Romanomermis culicivorax TaxID=13658 RepID=A0A915IYQ2_ROMCU